MSDKLTCHDRDGGKREVKEWAAAIAAAPQPEPNPNWCAGCSPDNCSGCVTFYKIKKQRDDLLSALEQFATWGRMQHKAQSKGGHATFDMLLLKDEIDLAEAAIASVKEEQP